MNREPGDPRWLEVGDVGPSRPRARAVSSYRIPLDPDPPLPSDDLELLVEFFTIGYTLRTRRLGPADTRILVRRCRRLITQLARREDAA